MEQSHILDNDKSALLDIFVWLFLVSSVLGVLVETSTKLVIRQRLGPEDYLIILSLVFAVAQSGCVGLQISNGLGKHLDVLSSSQLETIFKAEYASNLLFIFCLFFTKLSLIIFIKNLAIFKSYRYAAYGLATLTTLWTASSIFSASFQCHPPQSWNYTDNTCIDRKMFWNFYAVMNMVTDMGPIILMIIITSRIHTSLSRKITVAGVFGSRVVVIAAVACQLYYMNRAMPTSDPTFDMWPTWICIQFVQALAIITTCIPYLKPFMDSLESGGIRVDDQRRRGTNGYGTYSNTNGSNKPSAKSPGGSKSIPSRGSNNNSGNNAGDSRRYRRQSSDSIHGLGIMGNLANIRGPTRSPRNDWDDDAGSESSQSRIIRETKTFTIDVERV